MFWILAVDIKVFFLCTGFIYELEKLEMKFLKCLDLHCQFSYCITILLPLIRL